MAASQEPDPTTIAGADAEAHAEWTQQVTDLVTDSVDKVRSRTTGPVMGAARGLIYGVVALIVAVPVLVAAFVGFIRLLNWAVPGDVWFVYAGLAVLLWIAGSISWTRRESRLVTE